MGNTGERSFQSEGPSPDEMALMSWFCNARDKKGEKATVSKGSF